MQMQQGRTVDAAGTKTPAAVLHTKSSAGRRTVLTANDGRAALSEQELRQHIDDATVLMFRAYGLFRDYGCAHDRDEAMQALRIQQDALRARTPDMEREDREEFEARWNYFGSDAAIEQGATAA